MSANYHVLLCPSGSENLSSKDPTKENVTNKLLRTQLDQAPSVLTGSKQKVDVPPNKPNSSQPQITAPSSQPEAKPRHIKLAQAPIYDNFVKPPPPPIKPRDISAKGGETPLPRGPLSYDALVHLRKSASEKMTPLCPKIDHTIDLEKHQPTPVEDPKQESNESDLQTPLTGKAAPPAVAPKPKKIPAVVPVKTPDQTRLLSDPSYKLKHCSDAQVVRLEALHKLGLLQEQEPQMETVAPAPPVPPVPPPKPKNFVSPTSDKLSGGPSNSHPLRSPSFCDSQVVTKPKVRPLQSSISFQHSSRHEQQTVDASHHVQPSTVKPDGPQPSASLNNHKGPAPCPKPLHIPALHPTQATSASQATPNTNSNAVGYTVMVVPGMGADRKEALRKLGLLKV